MVRRRIVRVPLTDRTLFVSTPYKIIIIINYKTTTSQALQCSSCNIFMSRVIMPFKKSGQTGCILSQSTYQTGIYHIEGHLCIHRFPTVPPGAIGGSSTQISKGNIHIWLPLGPSMAWGPDLGEVLFLSDREVQRLLGRKSFGHSALGACCG
jgi:hypothetical protein